MTINVTSAKLLKIAEFVLLIAILGLLLWSQPWNDNSSSVTRKVTVTGEATVEATPDEYEFNPYFEASGTDQEAVKSELNTKTADAVAKLKELGVAEEDLKLDISNYDYWYPDDKGEGTTMAYIRIRVDSQELADKVQQYLTDAGTDVKGSLTPQATFSEEKQNELENQASDKAIEDAKKKAEQQASLLGSKIGKVIEVSESSSGGMPIVYNDLMARESTATSAEASVEFLPGQNEYTKTITVTYELQ